MLQCILEDTELHLFQKYFLSTDLIFCHMFEGSDDAVCYFLVTLPCTKSWFCDSFLHGCVDLDSHVLN